MKKLKIIVAWLLAIRWTIYGLGLIPAVMDAWSNFIGDNSVGKSLAALFSSDEIPWCYLSKGYAIYYKVFGIYALLAVILWLYINKVQDSDAWRRLKEFLSNLFRKRIPNIKRIYVRYIDENGREDCVDIQKVKKATFEKQGIELEYCPDSKHVTATFDQKRLLLNRNWKEIKGISFRTTEFDEIPMSDYRVSM